MYNQFHGEQKEDEKLRQFFPYDYVGAFLDVGAGHPITISNSYHFRQNGWTIYSIEPNPMLAQLYRDNGYNIAQCAVGSLPSKVEFDAYYNDLGWGGNVSSRDCTKGSSYQVILVDVRTIDDVLEEWKVDHLDIVSIDIELSETDALKGFNISKYNPLVCVIEDHQPDQSGITEFMAGHGYQMIGRDNVNNFYLKS